LDRSLKGSSPGWLPRALTNCYSIRHLVLLHLPDERDACVGGLVFLLKSADVDQAHVVREDGKARSPSPFRAQEQTSQAKRR
jgi:hypothetical protein